MNRVPLDHVRLNRRNFLVALTGGAALWLFAASRNSNKIAVPYPKDPIKGICRATEQQLRDPSLRSG
jgi:hypothetical protein